MGIWVTLFDMTVRLVKYVIARIFSLFLFARDVHLCNYSPMMYIYAISTLFASVSKEVCFSQKQEILHGVFVFTVFIAAYRLCL